LKIENSNQRYQEKQRNVIEVIGLKEEGAIVVFRYPGEPDQSLPIDQFSEQFEVVYPELEETFSFGRAIELLKQGEKAARSGWNGKGLFVVYQKGYPQGIPCNAQTAAAWGLNEGDLFVCNPYLQIKQADGSHSMWVPSIGDVLAEDWVIVV
jgi:hypothetical protein